MNAMICQLQDLPRYMESENKSFQPWRDYMKLAELVREMQLGNFTSEPSTVDEFPQRALLSPITPVSTPPLPGRKTPEEVPSPERQFCSFCKHNGESESVFLSCQFRPSVLYSGTF
uniref:Nanos-type domain-containing protein n=1 Tax=Hucho hucho TaxID=62062 RepID=A0A4W5NMR4_9TELE